jgi:flavorubredoxin
MKAQPIAKKVYWVGATDWGIRDFHGYATERGTTYNAYLIIDEKITLIDTVKRPFLDELLARISSIINPEDIDYIISNHAEMDHAGCLKELIEIAKPEKVFASPMGIKTLESHYNCDLNITPVKTGESLSLGENTLTFIETKMLHWPDSMICYLPEQEILFSQDAFGMHLATREIFDDNIPEYILEWESEKYFANILMNYSEKILTLLKDVKAMNIPIRLLANDHGPIWRKHTNKIISLYEKWATHAYTPKAIVLYDTMWGATAKMAAYINDGIADTGIEVKTIPMSSSHRSDVATEILSASALVIGSPTLNNNIFPSIADVITYLKGLKPKNLIGASFGSYGWSGEALKQLNGFLTDMNVELISEGIRVKFTPTEDDLAKCYALGQEIGQALKDKCIKNQ